MTFRLTPFLLIGLIACSLLLALPAQARWFGKEDPKKKAEQEAVERVQTYQPPPEDALQTQCEPIRQQAIQLSQKPKLLKIFYQPRRAILINRHRRCQRHIMEQQNTYLKHVDIEQAPSLPKMPAMPATPFTKEGNP